MPLREVLEEDRVVRVADDPSASHIVENGELELGFLRGGAELQDDATVIKLRGMPGVLTSPDPTLVESLIDKNTTRATALERRSRHDGSNPSSHVEKRSLRTGPLIHRRP
ncbi:hypothetical protein G3N18_03950 [Microbacterium sp. 2C]|nr:hypothetical protein [Microbacterium paulum]